MSEGQPQDARSWLAWPLGLAGAALGGLIGYVLFVWLLRQGLYALALPGAALGLGAGLTARRHAPAFRLLCGLSGAVLMLLAIWHAAPFIADNSLGFFVTHLHQGSPINWVAIVLSGLAAWWLSEGRLGRDRG